VINNDDNSETEIKDYDEKDIDLDFKNSDIVYIKLDSENTSTTDDSTIQISGQQITIKKS
jgi:hypothetical protein